MKNNSKTVFKRYAFWTAALAVMAVVFWHSSRTAPESTAQSETFAENIFSFFSPSFSALDEAGKMSILSATQHLVRKSAHFLAYFALGFTCFGALNTYGIKRSTKFFASGLICLVYAVSDEVHQLFVPGRAGRLTDVLIDLSGALSAIGIYILLSILYNKITKKQGEGSMRKKDLVRKIEQLIDSMNSLQEQLNAVSRENSELKVELENLRLKNKKLSESAVETARPAAVYEPEPAPPAKPEAQGFVVSQIEDEVTVKTETVSKPETAPEPKPHAVVSVFDNDITEYGSVAIGTVVQESVRYAGLISSSQAENKKELLNLIMGKGEIAKAEIFGIVEGDSPADTKRELIDGQLKETIDYFKSVAGQI